MPRVYRLQVPVQPETRKAIEDYADALGLGPAAAAGQLLEQSAPMLGEMTRALRKAKEHPAKGLRDAAAALTRATEKADQLAMDLSVGPQGRSKPKTKAKQRKTRKVS